MLFLNFQPSIFTSHELSNWQDHVGEPTLALVSWTRVGNFWGSKLSWISQFCGYSQKFSPWNLGTWCPLVQHKQAICESLLRENCIFNQSAKVFSLESFPLWWWEPGNEAKQVTHENRTVYKAASKHKWLYFTAIYNWWGVSSASWSQLPRRKMLLSVLQASHKVLLSLPCQKMCVAFHSIIFCVHPIPAAKHASIK